jgi:phosphoribosylformylglycinamidine (FGAM) synthase-like enzyme
MSFHNNNSIMVANIGGTSSDRYSIDRLYQKYLAEGGTSSSTCQVKGCDRPASATAHVRLVDGRRSNDWFLTRTCASHNHPSNTDPYPLRINAKLVRVRDITGS